MEINVPNKGFPRLGEICPQGVKALAPSQAAMVDFRAVFPLPLAQKLQMRYTIIIRLHRCSGEK